MDSLRLPKRSFTISYSIRLSSYSRFGVRQWEEWSIAMAFIFRYGTIRLRDDYDTIRQTTKSSKQQVPHSTKRKTLGISINRYRWMEELPEIYLSYRTSINQHGVFLCHLVLAKDLIWQLWRGGNGGKWMYLQRSGGWPMNTEARSESQFYGLIGGR